MACEPFSIVTERLTLRPLEERDVPDLVAYLSEDDPMIRRVMKVHPSPEGVRAYWGKMRGLSPYNDPSWYSLLIELVSERKVIGNCGFGVDRIDEEHVQGSIGWSLSGRYRNRGIATEAVRALLEFLFGALKLHRVYARTGADNVRSWKLMERVGMRREAHFRESHTNLAKQWADEYIYAMLRDEWTSRREPQR